MQSATSDLTVPVDPQRDRIRGAADAPVTIVEYADYECPYCAEAHAAVTRLLAACGDRVRFVFRVFPLAMHEHAHAAAEAAESAAAQGRFWEMHDLLFDHQDKLGSADLQRYAHAAGIDAARMANDLEAHTFDDTIDASMRSGEESGVEGTPTFYINGRLFDDEPTYEALRDAVDALATSGTVG